MQLADVLHDVLHHPHVRLRAARIAGWSNGRATITLAGQTVTQVPYLAIYTPTTGDTVQVLQTGPQLLILGKVT